MRQRFYIPVLFVVMLGLPGHTMLAQDSPPLLAEHPQLRDLLHHSPRDYGKSTSLWTLELVAEACFEKGITAQRVSGETVRATLKRIGIRWKRAKHWITSPDPGYERKKSVGIG